MTTIQDLYAAVDAAVQAHFGWCTDHNYEDPEPDTQLCRSTFALDFTATLERDNDDLTAISVELAGSHSDVEHGRQVPTASIGFNGGFGEREIMPWKLTPIAFMLMAAQARAEGDQERAQAFEDAANAAIVEHISQAEDEPEPEYVVARPSSSPWITPHYVQGTDPDDGVITYDEYLVRKAVEAGIPQVVIHHAEDGRRFVVVGALDSKPVDGVEYDDFDAAKTVRDRLNEKARAAAAAVQSPSPRTVVEADCGHYMVVADGESVDGEHYTDQDAAQAAAEILTAEQLEALPLHAEVTDNKGVEWKKFFGGGWSFRCLGGHNRDQQSSEFLAQYAPRLLQRAGGAR